MKHTRRILSALLAAAMLFSLLPATAFAAEGTGSETSSGGAAVTIDVTEYGADPTGVKESSTAVIAALEYAKTLGDDVPKTIFFPRGEYHFYADYSEVRELYVSNTVGANQTYKNKHLGILVEDLDNITIDGGGSQFIYHGDITSFATIRSNNVKFQNFSVDHASPSVVDVTVESIEGQTATLYIPPCYTYTISGTNINWQGERGPVTGTPYWSGSNNLGYRQGMNTIDGHTQRGTGGPFNGDGAVSTVTNIQQVPGDPTHIKVTYSGSLPVLGMCYQLRNTTRTTPGTFFWESDGVTLQDIDIQFLHGFGMVGQLSKNITLDTVKFEARPGTGRTTAGFADFVQMSSVGGKVTIRNCEFSNPHDDPINIHGTFLEVAEVSNGNKTFKVQYKHGETAGFPQYYVGDTVDFSVKSSMAPVANSEREVVAVTNPGEGGNDLTTITITLDEPVNGITAGNYVVENVTYTPEVLIENCRFVETPTRGILVTTRREVIIQNNYFDRMGMAAIYISCDASNWRESGRTENVTIRDNTFVVDPYTTAQAAIYVDPSGNGSAGNRIHKNMLIENNVFNMAGQSVNAIYAKSVNGLTIRNNIIQRYTPSVSMTLSGTQSVAVGGTQATTLVSSGSTYGPSTRMLRFDDCENVTLENNIYDDGLFVGIGGNSSSQISGSDMALNGDRQLPAVGTVQYFSSDTTVATVDESGVVTGVGAGTAEIYAYRVAGARTFESNHLTFTVTGSAAGSPNKIEITGGSTVDVNGTVNLTAAVDPAGAGSVAWAVKPATDGTAATISQEGVLTATVPGVVEVTATLGGVTASKLITVNKPNFEYLSDLSWTGTPTMGDGGSAPKLDKAWSNVAIMLKNSANETETFAKGLGVHAPAEITYDLAGKGYTHFTAKVGVSQDVDGVVKPAEAKLKFTVRGDGSELASSSGTQMTKSDAYQEIDVDISNVNTLVIKTTDPTGNNWSAHGNWADAKLYTNNQAPTASGVTATAGSGVVTLNYTYGDTDNDAETGSLIAWYVSDAQNGHYTRLENASSDTLTITAATSEKWVKAVVVPRDATGRCGAPVASAAVQAPAQTAVQGDATLASLSVAGLALTPAFDPSVEAYTISVPASASKVTIAATATQGNAATVTGTGEVMLTGTETAANVTVTAPNGTTRKTYTVTIHRAASSDATLSGLTATAGSASITYNAATRFYELVAAQNAETLTFSAIKSDDNAAIAVRFNAEEKGAYEDAPKTLPLMAGINNLELRVTAADGISTALYRVRVMKPASAEAELTGLTVNGGTVTIPAGSADLGLVQVTGDTATLNATVSSGAAVLISVDGKPAQNNTAVTLEKALTMATFRVVAEDGVTENVYTLALSKPDSDNADLYLLKLEGMVLSPAFDPSVTEYTATFTDMRGVSALTAAATQAGADVTCETVSVYETAKGRIARDCHFFRDVEENFVKITVASPNGGTTKEYIINVAYEPVVYLSDLQWTSHTSGWSSGWPNPGVDIGVENNPMTLWNGSSWETFEKGLGTHANSQTAFNISGRGFARFTAKVGPNKNSGSPHISFEVQGDGKTLWSSDGEITHSDPYQTIDIDVSGVSTLKIIDNQSGGNGSAHATWADAKFYGGSIGPAIAGTDIAVSYIEFEHDSHTIYVNGTAADKAHPNSVELHPTFKPVGVTDSAHTLVLDWDSSVDSVATVTGGVVTPFGVGETVITATAIDKTATDTCTITVKKLVEGEFSVNSVNGDLRCGSGLTVRDNEFDEDVKGSLIYTWYRGEDTSGTKLGAGKTYTPVKEDIGSKLTVKAAAVEDSYYEGEVTFTTGEIGLEAGHEVNEDNLTYQNCTNETAEDGEIQGLLAGHVYQYQKQNADGSWPTNKESWIDVDENASAITGLAPGSYRIRHIGDDTREPGAPSNTITISVVGTALVALTVPQRFPGGVVRANRAQIPVEDTVTLTVTPDKGYELDTLTATYTENGVERTLTPTVGDDGKYTFTMPAFPVTIGATFTKITYTIGHGLENISCNEEEHQHTATHGEEFSITLTPDGGYNMPSALTVTETATGKKFTDFTYDAHETAPAKRVLTFPNGVTCDITVKGAGVPKNYTVVYELTNGLTAPGAPQTATHGKELSVTLTPARGYSLPASITVKVNDTALESDQFTYDRETGAVEIPEGSITGSVVITAQGEALSVALQSVAIVGPAQVGRTLSVNTDPVLATVDYQWILVDEDGTETPIDGADGNRYVIPEEAEGKTIRVRVTGTGGYNGTLTSEPTAAVRPQSEPFVLVTAIKLEPVETSVAVDGTVQIGATVEPDNATSGILYWFSSNDAIATVDQNGLVTGVAEGTATITARSTDTVYPVTAECAVTVTAKQVVTPPDDPAGEAAIPSIPATSTTTTTTKKPDGSITTTVKDNAAGTVTETTKKPDGTVETVETKKDGTKTETTEKPDGSTEVVETRPDGTVTETTKNTDGSTEVVETRKDGTITATATDAEGGKVEKVTTPEKDVAITVSDNQGEVLAEVKIPNQIPEPETRFVDVPEGHWADKAIHNMAALEVVNGVGNNTFNRNGDMKRGDLALILSRLSNGGGGYELSFTDVPATKYYANGVAWAAKTGVVTGRSKDTFAPEDTITREELAVMLYRYAKLLKLDAETSEEVLDGFKDGGDTHGWAEDGVAWCVDKGILRGKGNNILDPRTNVTRAEVAVMLERFTKLLCD